MAEPKKPEKKAEAEPLFNDGQDFAFKVIGALFFLMVLGSLSARLGYGNFIDTLINNQDSDERIDEQILESDLDLGDEIVNLKKVIVRQAPAGSSVGFQDKRTKGRLVEGPIPTGNIDWWRVDYPTAPDGWVIGDDVTNKIGTFTTLNIFPIVFSVVKPVNLILSFIIFILIVIVLLKKWELKKTLQKKAQVEKEQDMIKRGHLPHVVQSTDTSVLKQDEMVIQVDEGEITPEDLPIHNLPIGDKPKTEEPSNRRWANIQSLVHSYNMNDWKQAIIEADTILDEMLDKMGYKGQSIGEKLKKIEPSDFITLNQAWEAHKVRNRIAHSGSNFSLSKDEAERIIGLYKEIFSEFFYI
jgi:hypothetical protein